MNEQLKELTERLKELASERTEINSNLSELQKELDDDCLSVTGACPSSFRNVACTCYKQRILSDIYKLKLQYASIGDKILDTMNNLALVTFEIHNAINLEDVM